MKQDDVSDRAKDVLEKIETDGAQLSDVRRGDARISENGWARKGLQCYR